MTRRLLLPDGTVEKPCVCGTWVETNADGLCSRCAECYGRCSHCRRIVNARTLLVVGTTKAKLCRECVDKFLTAIEPTDTEESVGEYGDEPEDRYDRDD